MKLLVIGSTGLLGQALISEIKERGMEVVGIARSGADISCDITDKKSLENNIATIEPDIIINCAALVNLNECEKNPEYAYMINARPASIISEIATENDLYFIQISTDHYYTGDGNLKHNEDETVRLLNEYARTKFAAEKFALTCPNSLIVRTNIVGFRNKEGTSTFTEWVIENIKNRTPMTLFDDYFTSSIHVKQFSSSLLDIIEKKHTGVLNLASREVSSKKTFISALAEKMGVELTNSATGSLVDAGGEITRAESNGLDVEVAESILGYKLPALDDVITCILQEYYGGFENEV
jgi:dTDP-4-dehydrorhamnose reductase